MFGSILAVTGAFTQQCSSSPTTSDAGPDVSTLKDHAVPETAAQDSGEAGVVVTPAGTELYPSDDIQIFGVTTDGYVIFADEATTSATPQELYGQNLSGGAPIEIASLGSGAVVGIAGKVVFVWAGITSTTAEVGALSLWISTGTLKSAVPKSSPTAGFAASADGTKVIYSANANTAATVSDFVGANSDATSPQTIATAVDISTGSCTPVVDFAGGTVPITATCAVNPGDGGTPIAIVSSYNPASNWAATQIISNALNFESSDTAGDKVLVATTTNLQSFPIPFAAGVQVDSKSIQGGFGYLNKAGTSAIYSTAAGSLWESPIPPSTPVELQTTGVKYVRALSANDDYLIYSTTLDAMNFGGDLYLSKTTAQGTAQTLITGTGGALFGLTSADDFTADSSYVLWIENLVESEGVGDLYAMTVAGSGTPTKIASAEWQNASATGTKVIYNNNCPSCSGTANMGKATADIYAVDVATTNAPTLLQAGADVPLTAANSLYLNPAKDHVIYTYSQNNASTSTPPLGGNGLYSVAIP
jgi:hypothetical protein